MATNRFSTFPPLSFLQDTILQTPPQVHTAKLLAACCFRERRSKQSTLGSLGPRTVQGKTQECSVSLDM